MPCANRTRPTQSGETSDSTGGPSRTSVGQACTSILLYDNAPVYTIYKQDELDHIISGRSPYSNFCFILFLFSTLTLSSPNRRSPVELDRRWISPQPPQSRHLQLALSKTTLSYPRRHLHTLLFVVSFFHSNTAHYTMAAKRPNFLLIVADGTCARSSLSYWSLVDTQPCRHSLTHTLSLSKQTLATRTWAALAPKSARPTSTALPVKAFNLQTVSPHLYIQNYIASPLTFQSTPLQHARLRARCSCRAPTTTWPASVS